MGRVVGGKGERDEGGRRRGREREEGRGGEGRWTVCTENQHATRGGGTGGCVRWEDGERRGEGKSVTTTCV